MFELFTTFILTTTTETVIQTILWPRKFYLTFICFFFLGKWKLFLFTCFCSESVAFVFTVTYMSGLYPSSEPDKCNVEESVLYLVIWFWLIKDFFFKICCQKNISPFLKCGKFTESEARATKLIARCSTHVERANATSKTFKIRSFIPSVSV